MAYRGSMTFGYGLTPWVQRLIIANVGVFLVQYIVPELTYHMAFIPGAVLLRPWTLLTYMFAHGGFMHLFFNMLGLFFFGPPLEARWGSREFLKFYFLCGFGGAALSFLFAFHSPIIGASAAVYGVMLAFAMHWPDSPIYIWGIFPIQAKWLVGIIAAFSLMSAFNGRADGVAHFAHLGGFVAAFLYVKWGGVGQGRGGRLRDLVSRRRFKVVPGGRAVSKVPAPRAAAHTAGPAGADEKLLDELDRVLEKISTAGMSSLTPEERRLLDDVSRRYRQN
jgi:membrane associated rhomboid family serine protease